MAVVSRGDQQLVEIGGRTGWHFPRDAEGAYAGFHPRSSEDAIAHIQAVRGGGGDFLCLPASSSWWLDHYRGLADWLSGHCLTVADEPGACVVYDLRRGPDASRRPDAPVRDGAIVGQMTAMLGSLLPQNSRLCVIGDAPAGLAPPDCSVVALGTDLPTAQRTLRSEAAQRSVFVLFAGRASSVPTSPARLDPEWLAFLEHEAEQIADRENFCSLWRFQASPAPSRSERRGPPERGSTNVAQRLEGERAVRLTRRLERLAGDRRIGSRGLEAPQRTGQPR